MKKLASPVKYFILFLTGVSILYFLFKGQYNPDFFTDLKRANWIWAAAAGILVLISHIFRALRWQLMIIPLAKQRPLFLNVFNALMVGYLTNLILPRAGEILKCGLLAKKERVNFTALIGTVIAERMLDLLMLLLLIFIAAFIYAPVLFPFLQTLDMLAFFKSDQFIGSIVVLSLVIILIFFIRRFKSDHVVLSKLKDLFSKLKEGFLSIKGVKSPVLFMVYTLAIWVFYVLSSYVGFRLFVGTANLDLPAAVLTVIAGSLGMMAPIQGGIGAFHFMVTACLRVVGVSKSTGLEYATILHASQTLVVIIFGLIGLALGFNYKYHINEER